MHMLIYILVPGQDKDEAISNAHGALATLIEAGVFDSCSLGADSHMDDMPEPARTNTSEGKALVEQASRESKDEFISNINDIKAALGTFTTDELFEGNPGEKDDPGYNCRLFRHLCCQLGMSRGTGVCLYDEDGCGIQTTRDLEEALKKEDLWAVPADVHT